MRWEIAPAPSPCPRGTRGQCSIRAQPRVAVGAFVMGSSAWVRPVLITVLAAMFVAIFASAREAAAIPMTRIWTGNGADNNWMTAANWDSGVPANNDTLVFPPVANRKSNTNNFPPSTFFFDIRFTGSGYTLGGNVLRIDGLVINDATTGINTINLALVGVGGVDVTAGTLRMNGGHNYSGPTNVRTGAELIAGSDGSFGSPAGGTTVAAGGTISLLSGVQIASEVLTIGGGPASVVRAPDQAFWNGNIVLSGVLTEFNLIGSFFVGGIISGPNTASLMKSGPGYLVLNAANTYLGGTIVAEGVVRARSLGALATSVVPGATLELDDDTHLLSEPVFLKGAGVDGQGALRSSGSPTSAYNVTLDGPTAIGALYSNTTLTLPAGLKQVDGTATLSKVGPGTLFLNGAGSFVGEITVVEGALSVNVGGSGIPNNVVVRDEGRVRGSGEVAGLELRGGEGRPGVGTSPASFTVNGILTLDSASRLTFDIDGLTAGTQYSRFDVSGSVTLGGATLAVDLGFTPKVGDTFAIIQKVNAGAIVGTFAGLPEGATFTVDGVVFTISYKFPSGTGNDVAITVTGLASSDLSVELAGSPSPAQASGLLTYTITVRNAGPQAASNAQLTFGVPAKTTFESVTPNAGWTCTKPAVGGTGNVSCGIGTLSSGAAATFAVVVRVNSAANGTIAASAAVTSASGDPQAANNSAATTTSIGAADPRPFKSRIPMTARDG
ncbi:MAG: hypothetical protein C0506_05620 [Anaerolinea sp.]|nr:hypothetical protein [Anaerolinea sp.]